MRRNVRWIGQPEICVWRKQSERQSDKELLNFNKCRANVVGKHVNKVYQSLFAQVGRYHPGRTMEMADLDADARCTSLNN